MALSGHGLVHCTYLHFDPSGHGKPRDAAVDSLIVDMQDVAVRVLEPNCLEVSGDVDVAVALESGRIIMFESNTCLFRGLHDEVHFFADPPSCRRGLVGPGELRLVDNNCRIAASQCDDTASFGAGGRETKLFLVKFLGCGMIFDRNGRHCILVC
jgi:hypothetical protein